MQRVDYYEQRERDLQPPMSPDYHKKLPGADPMHIMAQRTVCVDRIFRLGYYVSAMDSTCFAAIRLFDRCMGAMRPPIARTNMMLLAISCFDIVHKASDGDFERSSLRAYYTQAMTNHCNDYTIPFDRFGIKLMETEIIVLEAVEGEPVCPTPQDYISECCPSWYGQGDDVRSRRVSLLCSSFLYACNSTNYTSGQIAAAAARLEIGCHPPPSAEIAALCSKISTAEACKIGSMMIDSMDKLFTVERDSMMYYWYRDLYNAWDSGRRAVARAAERHKEKVIASL